ncbi:MAG: carboxylating nicotinate-nucleotide diphosphorylase [bacterium]
MMYFSRAIQPLVDLALAEDIGTGDVTTLTTIPEDAHATAEFMVKADGVIAGLPAVKQVFHTLDPTVNYEMLIADGCPVKYGEIVARVSGSAQVLLTAERTALNFLQHLSGIATLTASYVEAVKGTRARIVDTRKTLPGMRILDKYAVCMGGGSNHRFSLADGVLIKDNHIAAAGGISQAICAARAWVPHTLKIEVETEDRAMVEEAVTAGADIIMLDNMSLAEMRSCVEYIAGRALTEASGGVNLATVREIAECGVDLISVGALTHSVTALDISMNFTD